MSLEFHSLATRGARGDVLQALSQMRVDEDRRRIEEQRAEEARLKERAERERRREARRHEG